MIIRRLIMASTLSLAIVDAGRVFAQTAFPAPLPGQAEAPTGAGRVPYMETIAPPGRGTDACMTGFLPLREAAEKRSRLIMAAAERRAPPEEACKLIGDFGQAEIKMIRYIQANAARCGIPPQTAEQFKSSRRNTEKLQKQVCTLAQLHPPAGPDRMLGPGDFWFDRPGVMEQVAKIEFSPR